MQKEIEIALSPEFVEDKKRILSEGSKKLKISSDRIKGFHIRKRSIDARGKQVLFRMRVVYFIDEKAQVPESHTKLLAANDAQPVIIIGAGPAGLFAAYRCLELGLKPIVIERGKRVQDRRRDLAKINREGFVWQIIYTLK